MMTETDEKPTTGFRDPARAAHRRAHRAATARAAWAAAKAAGVLRAGQWSSDDDTRLAALYPAASWSSIRAEFPGRSRAAIERRAGQLGARRAAAAKSHGIAQGGGPRWTASEDQTIRALYPDSPWDALLAELPGRAPASVHARARRLGVKRRVRGRLEPTPRPGPPRGRGPRRAWTPPGEVP
jgi:hypothetical protein